MPQQDEKTTTNPAKRVAYLSLLRVLSCLGIVVLHTYYTYVSYFEASPAQRVVSFAVRNAMMWAVPCFVMVTGALLLDPSRTVTIKKLFTKYILRAALAIGIFTLVFYVFDLWMSATGPRLSDVTAILMKLYEDGSWTHMWYLYMLIGLYLLMPAYRLVAGGASDATMRYLLLVGAVFLILLPNLDVLTGRKTGFYIGVYTVYPLYLFLGYALHQGIIRIPRRTAGIMFGAAIVVIAALTVVQMKQGSAALSKLLGNYSFAVIAVAAAGLFALLKEEEQKSTAAMKTATRKVVDLIDENAFGIYLVHFMVLKFAVVILRFNPYQAGGNLLLAVISLLVFVLSLLLTALLRKIPFMKKVL